MHRRDVNKGADFATLVFECQDFGFTLAYLHVTEIKFTRLEDRDWREALFELLVVSIPLVRIDQRIVSVPQLPEVFAGLGLLVGRPAVRMKFLGPCLISSPDGLVVGSHDNAEDVVVGGCCVAHDANQMPRPPVC